MFEQAFKNIDVMLRKEAGCTTELDYTEQTSWLLFLKYLDGLEKDLSDQAKLEGKRYAYILDKPYRWESWAAPKTKDGTLDHDKALIHKRADATKPLMGLKSTRPGKIIRREDVSIAKNYLTEDELRALNLIVSFYIEFAELQALERRPMTMRKWIDKLDEFLKLSDRALLGHAGKVSADAAKVKAEQEYERYRAQLDAQPRAVDIEFEKAAKQLQKLPRPKRPKKPKA